MPHEAFRKLTDILAPFSSDISTNTLKEEYINFTRKWNMLKKNSLEEFRCADELQKKSEEDVSENRPEDIKSDQKLCVNEKICKNCPKYCYQVLKNIICITIVIQI